jgi:hypothetical protein
VYPNLTPSIWILSHQWRDTLPILTIHQPQSDAIDLDREPSQPATLRSTLQKPSTKRRSAATPPSPTTDTVYANVYFLTKKNEKK